MQNIVSFIESKTSDVSRDIEECLCLCGYVRQSLSVSDMSERESETYERERYISLSDMSLTERLCLTYSQTCRIFTESETYERERYISHQRYLCHRERQRERHRYVSLTSLSEGHTFVRDMRLLQRHRRERDISLTRDFSEKETCLYLFFLFPLSLSLICLPPENFLEERHISVSLSFSISLSLFLSLSLSLVCLLWDGYGSFK